MSETEKQVDEAVAAAVAEETVKVAEEAVQEAAKEEPSKEEEAVAEAVVAEEPPKEDEAKTDEAEKAIKDAVASVKEDEDIPITFPQRVSDSLIRTVLEEHSCL